MKRLIIPLLAGAMVAILIAAGCAQPAPSPEPAPAPAPAPAPEELPFNTYEGLAIKPDGTPYRFLQLWSLTYTEWHGNAQPFFKSLIERAGGQVVDYDATGNPELQLGQLEDAALVHPDAIMAYPCTPYDLAAVAKDLWEETGIPIFSFDTSIFEEKDVLSPAIMAYAREDQFQTGYACGEWVVNYYREKGEKSIVFMVEGDPAFSGTAARRSGFEAAVDPYPDIIEAIYYSGPTDWTGATALAVTEDALIANPEINTIYSHYDGMCKGVIEALDIHDRLFPQPDPHHIVIATVGDGSTAYQGISEGTMDCASEVSSFKCPDLCAKLELTYVCLGQDISEHRILDIPVNVETAENINLGIEPLQWRDYPGKYDYWPIYDYLIPTPTKLDPATVAPNPLPGEEGLMPSPRLVTPTGYFD